MIKDFTQLLKQAQLIGPKKVSVAVAQDIEVLTAIKKAKELNIAEAILVGDKDKICEIAQEIDLSLENVDIIDEKDMVIATRIATELVSSGTAHVLMKGLVDTSIIMRQVLDRDIGLRNDIIISHVAVFEVKTYHKVFLLTDAAMNLAPDLKQKKEIIENAVGLAHSLGTGCPKIAVLAAKEKVSPKMEATIHAKELADMSKRDEIKGCIVDGPFALDNAINKESARIKGIESRVAGDADILLVPNIETGNVLYKALTFLAKAKSAGLIVGTKAPVVLTSRADNEEAKLYSIALAVLMSSGGEND